MSRRSGSLEGLDGDNRALVTMLWIILFVRFEITAEGKHEENNNSNIASYRQNPSREIMRHFVNDVKVTGFNLFVLSCTVIVPIRGRFHPKPDFIPTPGHG